MGDVPVHLRGVEGKLDAHGKVTHPGCKAIVVLQRDESDDPVPMMYAASVEDAKEYVVSMRAAGYGSGLRIVKQ